MSKDANTDTPREPMPLWMKGVLGLATLSVVSGAWLQLDARGQGPEAPAALKQMAESEPPAINGARLSEAGSEVAPRLEGPLAGSVREEIVKRSPVGEFLTNVGISFLVAFLVGAAVRSVIRKTTWLIKLSVGAIIVLSVAGVINVDWDDVRAEGQATVEKVKGESDRIIDLVAGLLPSTVAGGLGFLVGLTRR